MASNRKIKEQWVKKCIYTFNDDLPGEPVQYVMLELYGNKIGFRFSRARFEAGITQGLAREHNLSCLNNNGVYFLIYNDDKGNLKEVYVGKSDKRVNEKLGALNRINEHRRDKYRNWDEAVVLVYKDNSLNLTRVSYLENKFFEMIQEILGRKMLKNRNTPSPSDPNDERYALDEFAETEARRIVAELGYTFLEPRKKAGRIANGRHPFPKVKSAVGDNASKEDAEVEFVLKSRKVVIRGRNVKDGFMVYKGSPVCKPVDSFGRYCKSCVKFRNALIEEGAISNGLLTRDHIFSSPSAAATVMLGRSTNGRKRWVANDGRKYGEIFRS